MASRGRQSDLPATWDPMRAEFETSTYGAQCIDDETDGLHGELDHCRLYVRNVPQQLTEEGLKQLFGKFGRLNEAFLSADPTKTYGLIRYDTPGEAKLAMETLNRVEPWKLQINIAYKHGKRQHGNNASSSRQSVSARIQNKRSNNNYQQNSQRQMAPADQTYDDFNDTLSSSSKGRMSSRQDMAQERMSEEDMFGDVMTYIKELSQIDSQDPDLECELENLKLQGAALLYKQRLKALKAAEEKKSRSSNVGSRCYLPDGKIVVNMTDKGYDGEKVKRELDSNIGAAGGDSCIPGLREQRSSRCVDCGMPSQFYCARCEVTPYCSDLCQRRDWPRRHKAVCHNLARLSSPPIEPSLIAPADAIPVIPPLRRPRSPAGVNRRDDMPIARNVTNGATSSPARMVNGHQNKKPFNNENTSSRTSNFKQERASNNNDEKRNDNRAVNGRASFDNNRQPYDNNRKSYDNNRQPFDNNRKSYDNNRQNSDHSRQSFDNNRQNNKGQSGRLVNAQNDAEEWPAKKESQPKPVVAAPEVVKSIAPDALAKHTTALAATPVKRTIKPVKPLAVAKPLVPAKCLMELLEVGATIIISVDFPASACRVDNSSGFVCLCMHEDFQSSYESLCEPYAADCANLSKGFKPAPGDLFSLFVEEDEAWYRARLLSADDYTSALIDSGAICKAKPDNMREVPPRYIGLPEFCCLLVGDNVKLEDRFMATIEQKSADGESTVSLSSDGVNVVGKAILKRWLPTVQYPPAPATPQTTTPTVDTPSTSTAIIAVIPTVPRPQLKANTEVCLVHVAETGALTVRATDASVKRAYDAIEQGVVLEGKRAPLLKEPPKPGDMVLVKWTDGVHYRGLVMRTNVKQNKYLIEFVEEGITEKATLEDLYVCPSEYNLEKRPAVSSTLTLHDVTDTLSQPAAEFLKKLASSAQPLMLTLPNEAKSAPSGSPAVLNSNKENINKRVSDMCKPDWKKFEEKGGDILQTEVLLGTQLEYLPITPGPLQILDSSLLNEGCLSVCASDDKTREHMAYVLGALTERMGEYCESKLGRDPYMPRDEELCIARFPPYENWFRALKCEAENGAGSDNICVLYVDYGNIGYVQAKDLRKMVPEFVRGLPALANTVVLEGFPEMPSAATTAKLSAAFGIDESGAGGTISVTKLTQMTPGFYSAAVPALAEVLESMK